jgi:ABC-type lipoprotein export system ATPase subunit
MSAVAAGAEVLVELRGAGRSYQVGSAPVWALRGVSLEVHDGDFLAVTGPSGSGKSTLLHLIAGLDRPTEGSVTVRGRPLAGMDDRALTEYRRHQVGLVFQAFNLVPVLTAAENVELPAAIAGWAARRRAERSRELLERVGLADRAGQLPSQLSGGEQQRVAIARALMLSPTLVLADEPTGNLDSDSSAGIVSLFDDLHRSGQAVVLVTHDPTVAAAAVRVVSLRDGTVDSSGAGDGPARSDGRAGRVAPVHSIPGQTG